MSNQITYPGLQSGGKERHPDRASARNNINANHNQTSFRAKALICLAFHDPGLKPGATDAGADFQVSRLKNRPCLTKNEQYGLTKLSWYKSVQ
jgi:hypothetical protein